ncbi:MAG: hypothetical protein ACFFD6_10480 [Candidatus Thorarchaeota archaeon]
MQQLNYGTRAKASDCSLCEGEKLKTEFTKCVALLLALVLIFMSFQQSTATIVWEDNFDDGNYNGWTVTRGNWSATEGYLEVTPDLNENQRIWHPSSQVVGNWSFDVFQPAYTPWNPYPYTTTTPTTTITEYYPDLHVMFMGYGDNDLYHGYGVEFRKWYISLEKQAGDVESKQTLAQFYVGIGSDQNTWTHIDITRNSEGMMHVFINKADQDAEPAISARNTDFNQSERFLVDAWKGSYRIDNITVIDGPVPGIILPPNTTLLIAGAGFAVVLIIALVVRTKKFE